MKRMKTFFKYFIIFVAFYFLSNLATIELLKSSYRNKEFTVDFDSPKIEITDSKATITNGYVNGIITNNTGSDLIGKILKLDFINSRGNNVGTKYIDFGNLLQGETKDFTSKFNFDNVDKIVASIMDKSELPIDKSLLDFSLDDIKLDKFKFPWYIWFGAFIMVFG